MEQYLDTETVWEGNYEGTAKHLTKNGEKVEFGITENDLVKIMKEDDGFYTIYLKNGDIHIGMALWDEHRNGGKIYFRQISAPCWHYFLFKNIKGAQAKIAHP